MSEWSLSASKLKTFEQCQQRFRLEYIEGYRDHGPPNEYLRRGNAVHETIETLLCDQWGPDPTSMDATTLTTHLLDCYEQQGGAEGYELSADFDEQVRASLEAAARVISTIESIRGIELEIDFELDHPSVDRPFIGYVDVATSDQIIDWKTGKSEGKGTDELLQGAVYAAGYLDRFDELPSEIAFCYLNPQAGDEHPKKRSITPSDELFDELTTRARALLAAVDRGTFDATVSDETCHWCDVEPYCPASPVGAGSVDWHHYP